MSPTPSRQDSLQTRFEEVVADYLQAVAEGKAPDREQLLLGVPADELQQFRGLN